MKACIISLNFAEGKQIAEFLNNNCEILTKHFYDYKNLELGSKEETIDGVKEYFDSIYDDFFVFVEFPISFCFEYAYQKDPQTKFIYVEIDKSEWIQKMNFAAKNYSHGTTYLFEKFFCNYYKQTNKTKMSQLTNEELSDIYDLHLQAVDSFFQNNQNFIKLQSTDLNLNEKIKLFLNL